MTILVPHRELEAWTKNPKIVIHGMKVQHDGYVLFYSEMKVTPQGYIRDYSENPPEPSQPTLATLSRPEPQNTSQSQTEGKNEPLEVCPNCGVELEKGKECGICSPLMRALKEAKVNRREYYFKKQAEREEPRLPHPND